MGSPCRVEFLKKFYQHARFTWEFERFPWMESDLVDSRQLIAFSANTNFR